MNCKCPNECAVEPGNANYVIVTGPTCWDCGPYCDNDCAERRNGHPVDTRPISPAEAKNLGFDYVCRHCGNWIEDPEDE